MKLADLFLDRFLYRNNNQSLETKDSAFVAADSSEKDPAPIPSGGAAQDINISNVTIDGDKITPGTLPSTTLDVSNWGWGQTCAFSSTDLDTVSWGSGTFTSASGDTYSISAGNTGNMAAKTYIYLDLNVSETEYQKTTTSATAVGTGKVLIAVAENAAADATFMLSEATQIVGDNIIANTMDASKITAGTIDTDRLVATAIDGMTITGATVQTDSSGVRAVMTGNDITMYDASSAGVGDSSNLIFKRTDNDWSGNSFNMTSRSGVVNDLDNVLEIYPTAAANSGRYNYIIIGRAGNTTTSYATEVSINATNEIEFGIATNEIMAINPTRISCSYPMTPFADGSTTLGSTTIGWKALYLSDTAPATTTDAVYGVSGKLYYDGSALGTVTSVATSGAISGGPITGTGTITHLTTAGYKHVPTSGASQQFLKYSASGTAVWSYLAASANAGTIIPSGSTVTIGNSTYYYDEIWAGKVNHKVTTGNPTVLGDIVCHNDVSDQFRGIPTGTTVYSFDMTVV